MATKRLAGIATITMGQSPEGERTNFSGEGLPLLNGPTEFGAHHPIPMQFTTDARKLAKTADLLFCVRGSTTGRMNWADQNYAIGRGIAAIRHKSDPSIQPFVRACIEWQLPALLQAATGSTFPNVSAAQLAHLEVPDIDEADQRAIASILGSLDDKIDLNRRMNETLEAMARAIFKDWFVDFGPTRAKMEGRTPYLAPEIWSLFPDRLNNEGEPQGWCTEPLLEHARLISGGTPKTENPTYWNGNIAWASAKDVSQCTDAFLISTGRTITERGLNESAARLVPKMATVVVARGATTGRFGMFGREMAMNQTCYALAPIQGRACWLNCLFGSLVDELVHVAHGSVFDTITTRTLETAQAMIADPALLDSFEAVAAPLFNRVLANIEESQTLAGTRDLLLPKLMSGEIRVKDAEKIDEAES